MGIESVVTAAISVVVTVSTLVVYDIQIEKMKKDAESSIKSANIVLKTLQDSRCKIHYCPVGEVPMMDDLTFYTRDQLQYEIHSCYECGSVFETPPGVIVISPGTKEF
jgi:hypothetical protein